MIFWSKMVLVVLFIIALFAQPFIFLGFDMVIGYLISAAWLLMAFFFGLTLGPRLRSLRKAYEEHNNAN